MPKLEISEDTLKNILVTARDAGVHPDSIKNFLSAGYIPLPKQMEFHAAARWIDGKDTPTNILLGGSRGGAKTHSVFAQIALDDCQRCSGLKWLFLRKVQKTAEESFDDLVRKVLAGIRHKYTPSSGKVEFPNGSRILLGGYKDAADIDKYIGIDYDGIVVEEAGQLTEDKLHKIMGSRRSVRSDWRIRSYLTANPGGLGHAYLRTKAVVPTRMGKIEDWLYIHSMYYDNPYLPDEYITWLKSLEGVLAAMWREGDWDTFAGMALPMWNSAIHVIEPIFLSEYFPRWRSVDWGFASPYVGHWFARDLDTKRIYVYRETDAKMLTDAQQATQMKYLTPSNEFITATYADPHMWGRKSKDNIWYTTASEYALNGVPLTPSDADPVARLSRVQTHLGLLPDGKPGLVFFNTCPKTIHALSNIPTDPLNPHVVDTKSELDHWFDSVGYGLGHVSPSQSTGTNEEKTIEMFYAENEYYTSMAQLI